MATATRDQRDAPGAMRIREPVYFLGIGDQHLSAFAFRLLKGGGDAVHDLAVILHFYS